MRQMARMVILSWVLGMGGVTLIACGEKADEFGPYTARFAQMDTYHQQLLQMEAFIKADESEKAANTSKIIQTYLDDMETFGKIDDKRIVAGHNKLKRTLKNALKKLVEPDFPTFTVSALKQINLIRKQAVLHINILEKRWQEEGRTEAFPLAWPGNA